jgi:hypothetical protein
MKLSTLFVINAVLALLFGLAFVIFPAQVLSLYSAETNVTSIYMTRLLGAAFIGYAILTWLVKDSGGSAELRAILLALFVGDMLGFVISLYNQLLFSTSALSWSTVLIYLLLGLGFGYFFWKTPGSS